jgi:TrmH family RNA methyltransferase
VITSTKNPRISRAIKLQKRAFRDKERAFLVEGAQAIAEALAFPGGPRLEELYVTDQSHPVAVRARTSGVSVEVVTEEVMAKLTSTVTPQGLVAVAPFLDGGIEVLGRAGACVAVLCAGRDPGNAGTVVRSACASGADAVAFAGDSVDVYNPKTVRASAGALFHVPIVRDVALREVVDAIRLKGMAIYALAADGDRDLYSLDLSAPVAFFFGNEAWGLPDDTTALADATVRVPMSGPVESLNLAAAATVCLFEAARQRAGAGSELPAAAGQAGGHGAGGLDELIAASAHDIRSPVTGIRSLSITLQDRGDRLTPDQREMLVDGIVHESERVDLLIRQLVDAARVASGHLDFHVEEFDVADVVAELAAFTAVDPDHPELVWMSGSVPVVTDRLRLRQALGAFVEAQVWFAFEGSIEIVATASHKQLTLEVSRGEPSVTQSEAEQLFLPRQPGAGSGSKIGLYVTRAVAEAGGGSAAATVDDRLRLKLVVPL